MATFENRLVRAVIVFLYTAVLAGTWDVWWHGAIGRETFWEPPHILLYGTVTLAIASTVYGWHKTREKVWRNLALVLTLVPLSAPFDELWHRVFGVEDIASPLIIWSPPHVTLILALSGSFLLALPIIHRDKDRDAVRLFDALAFAGILSSLLFLVGPLQPTGPYELIGFWGAGLAAFFIAGMMLYAHHSIPGIAGATLFAAFFILINSITFGEHLRPDAPIKPHDHPPAWLIIFSLLLSALFTDTSEKLPFWLRGAAVGGLWSGLLYGFSSYFFRPEFQYSFSDGATAILASIIAGGIAGSAVNLLSRSASSSS